MKSLSRKADKAFTTAQAALTAQATALVVLIDHNLATISNHAKTLAKRAKLLRGERRVIESVIKAVGAGKDRRVAWQESQISAGRCAGCGSEDLAPGSKRYGMNCLARFRERAARRRNASKV